MRNSLRATVFVALALVQSGCGVSVPDMPEVWDRTDPEATQHMEMQIKLAILCELREAVHLARNVHYKIYYDGTNVATKEDQPVPDSWGAQITLSFTVDELSKFSPGISLNTPIHSGVTNFVGETVGATGLLASQTFGPLTTPQSYAFGLGGVLSSDANRLDKFETFYTIGDIATVLSENEICHEQPVAQLGPKSTSSPFLVISDLGIKRWLPAAVEVSNFLRSSRQAKNGEGQPLGSAGSFASDSISYDIKFIVVTDINVTPVWKLVRVSTPQSPALFDTSRSRTHELLITIGPGATKTVQTAKGPVTRTVAPSASAFNSHQAQEIGNAVAAALRTQ